MKVKPKFSVGDTIEKDPNSLRHRNYHPNSIEIVSIIDEDKQYNTSNPIWYRFVDKNTHDGLNGYQVQFIDAAYILSKSSHKKKIFKQELKKIIDDTKV